MRLEKLERERDEARAEVELWKTGSHPSIKDLRTENEKLRGLLREVRPAIFDLVDMADDADDRCLLDRIDAALKGGK